MSPIGSTPGATAPGNGANNDGIPVAGARSMALDKGHASNAIAADKPADYAYALRRKPVLEISGASRPEEPS